MVSLEAVASFTTSGQLEAHLQAGVDGKVGKVYRGDVRACHRKRDKQHVVGITGAQKRGAEVLEVVFGRNT